MRPLTAALAVPLVLASIACGKPAPRTPHGGAPIVVQIDTPSTNPPPQVVAPREDEPPPEPTSLPRAMRDALQRRVGRDDSPDAALFRSAHERLAGDDPRGARTAFFELVAKMPKSPLVPYAYLAFADMFFEEAEAGDKAKYPLAKQAYLEASKYPPPANEAYAYALHQRGVVCRKSAEAQDALAAQRSAITALARFREAPLRREILAAARRELALAYADAGAPDKAAQFFQATDPEGAPGLVLALGEEYARRSAVREAITLYQGALQRDKSAALCAGAASTYRSLSATRERASREALERAESQRRSRCAP